MRRPSSSWCLTASLAFAIFAQDLPGQSCSPDWTPNLFTEGGVEGQVYVFQMFDPDGPGPSPTSLIAAGAFSEAGGFAASNIARWDGRNWFPLGIGLDGIVYAMTVFDEDGAGPNPARLFAGGEFTMAGGSAASYIARWDGASWSSVGGGVAASFGSPGVNTLLVHDKDGPGPFLPALFVGGRFDAAGGIPAYGLARWSGTTWSVVGQPGTGGLPPGSAVRRLTPFDDDGVAATPPKLAAAGYVWSLGSPWHRIALWDGDGWTFLGGIFATSTNFNESITALQALDIDGPGPLPEQLFVGGSFGTVDGVALNGVGVWTGSAWAGLGSGLTAGPGFPPPAPSAQSFAVHDEDGPGPLGPALFVGGFFGPAIGVNSPNIARWDGSSWSSVGGGVSGTVRALIDVDRDGPAPGFPHLLVAGDFGFAGGFGVGSIALWDGAWRKLGSAVDGTVEALIEYDPDGAGPAPSLLYAGGNFRIATAAGIASYAAFCDGISWSPVGPGPGAPVYAWITFDLDGNPATPPSLVASLDTGIAAWDGVAWTTLPLPFYTHFRALAVFDEDGPGPQPPSLYAGGFRDAQPILPSAEVRRWTGSAWALVGGTPFGCSGFPAIPVVYALAVFDEDGPGPGLPALFAGGGFGQIPAGCPSSLTNVAKWNGSSWQSVGGGLGFVQPLQQFVRDFAVFDPDGAGPAGAQLFACGSIAGFDNMARWDGTSWLTVSGGLSVGAACCLLNPSVERMLPMDPDGPGPTPPVLVAGGEFFASGTTPLNRIAYWDGSNWLPFGAGITGAGSIFGGRVAALLQFDVDGPGPLPAALFAGGDFGQAGNFSSGDLARWGVPPAISFNLSIGPAGSLDVTHVSCVPGGSYASFFSFDLLNGTAPGLGPVAGLHISPADFMLEVQVGVPPYIGVLGPGGGAQYSEPAANIAPLAGMTLYGVTFFYSPAALLPYIDSASSVASVVL